MATQELCETRGGMPSMYVGMADLPDGFLEACDAAAWDAFFAEKKAREKTKAGLFSMLRKGFAYVRKPAPAL